MGVVMSVFWRLLLSWRISVMDGGEKVSGIYVGDLMRGIFLAVHAFL